MYNKRVMQEFVNPQNAGGMKGANGIGQVGNMACGDVMKIYLRIDENEVIQDARFKTFGCAAAIATTSIATQLVKGKTIAEALEIKNSQIVDILGGLPQNKIHCSVLAEEALKAAVSDYYDRKEKEAKGIKKAAVNAED